MRLIRRLFLYAVLVISGQGCGSYLDWRYGEFEEIADQLIAAVSLDDSTVVRQLSVNSESVDWLLGVRGRNPDMVSAMVGNLELSAAKVVGDTAFVSFRFPHGDVDEELGIQFVRSAGNTWRVNSGFAGSI